MVSTRKAAPVRRVQRGSREISMDDPIATRTGRGKPRSFHGCHSRTEQALRVSDRSSIAFVAEEWN